jgi:putative protein-disulfide isomerase
LVEKPELLYVGDPLCSWCWGFAPSLRELRSRHADRFRFRLLVGGLRTGEHALPLDETLRRYLSHAWREVERRSGQPFDHGFLERATFVYDTEPACRAVVAARRLDPEGVFEFNESLQEAFYARGEDPTNVETFVSVARARGLDERSFRDELVSEATVRETRADFERARDLGVLGFPTTLLRTASELRLVASGFLPPDELLRRVEGPV